MQLVDKVVYIVMMLSKDFVLVLFSFVFDCDNE